MAHKIVGDTSDMEKIVGKEREIDLVYLCFLLWNKRRFIAIFSSIVTLFGLLYALFARPLYYSEVIIAPKESQKNSGTAALISKLGTFGGVVSTQLGVGNTDIARIEVIANGREVAGKVIDSLKLLPIIYSKLWNDEANSWKPNKPEDIPTLLNGIDRYQKDFIKVFVDKRNSTIKIGANSSSAILAEQIVRTHLAMLNQKLRDDVVIDAENNKKYLEKCLLLTSDPALKEKINNLISTEIERIMLVNSSSFDVLEKPIIPEKRIKPKRKMVLLCSIILGIAISLIIVVLKQILGKVISDNKESFYKFSKIDSCQQ
jgi:uncharacterized protein involved in exopolysaccharide biosynthesis